MNLELFMLLLAFFSAFSPSVKSASPTKAARARACVVCVIREQS